MMRYKKQTKKIILILLLAATFLACFQKIDVQNLTKEELRNTNQGWVNQDRKAITYNTQPENPEMEIQHIKDGKINTVLGVDNDIIYALDYDNQLLLYDISNPAFPQEKTTSQLDVYNIEQAIVNNNRLFILHYDNYGFYISSFDCEMQEPVKQSELKIFNRSIDWQIINYYPGYRYVLKNYYAFFCLENDQISTVIVHEKEEKLLEYTIVLTDCSNPEQLLIMGEHQNIFDNVYFDYDYYYNYDWQYSQVIVKNNTLYFNFYDSESFYSTLGLCVFDLSDENNIKLIKSANITHIRSMELYENYLITAESEYLKIYNTTGVLDTNPIYAIQTDNTPRGLLVTNDKLIVRYWSAIQIIDLSNITNPQVVSNFDIRRYASRFSLVQMHWSNNKLILSSKRTLVLLALDLGTLELSPINNGYNILMIISIVIIILLGVVFVIVYNTHKTLADKFVNGKDGSIIKDKTNNDMNNEKIENNIRVVKKKQHTLASNFITVAFIVFIIQNAMLILFTFMPLFFMEGTTASQISTILFFVMLFLDSLYALFFIIGLGIKLYTTRDNRYWIPIGCWLVWIGSSFAYRFAVGVGDELADLFLGFANGEANNLPLFYFMFAVSSVALMISMILTVDKAGYRNLRFIATFYGIANLICNTGLLFIFFIDFETISSPDIMIFSVLGFLGKLFGVTIIGFILAAFVIAENRQKIAVIKREEISHYTR